MALHIQLCQRGLVFVDEAHRRRGLVFFICEKGYDSCPAILADSVVGVTQMVGCETFMKLGYARLSKADGSQALDRLWRDLKHFPIGKRNG